MQNRFVTRTRKDLVKLVAARLGESQAKCKPYMDATLDSLAELMKEADPELRIELRNLGVYTVKFTKPRLNARNIQTGELMAVPWHRKVHFRPAKHLKAFLDQPQDPPV